jgi:hypothetical protein
MIQKFIYEWQKIILRKQKFSINRKLNNMHIDKKFANYELKKELEKRKKKIENELSVEYKNWSFIKFVIQSLYRFFAIIIDKIVKYTIKEPFFLPSTWSKWQYQRLKNRFLDVRGELRHTRAANIREGATFQQKLEFDLRRLEMLKEREHSLEEKLDKTHVTKLSKRLDECKLERLKLNKEIKKYESLRNYYKKYFQISAHTIEKIKKNTDIKNKKSDKILDLYESHILQERKFYHNLKKLELMVYEDLSFWGKLWKYLNSDLSFIINQLRYSIVKIDDTNYEM